ncbi:MAG: hypothetical protein K6C10_01745 [Prevotella sp.]|nr:hypothetical protein [Prevotella sp.]
MGLFNNKKEDEVPQQDLQELFQRLEHLERKCRRMEARIAELEEEFVSRRNQKASQMMDAPEAPVEAEGATEDNVVVQTIDEIGLTVQSSAEVGIGLTAQEPQSTAQETLLYLPTPTQDGFFSQASEYEQVGKSVYQLTTMDGQNGSFILLDTPDAIATAMISVSTFVKPVCKVNGPTSVQPRHIITEEEGTATREGAGWRVVRKAVVRFE